MHEVRMQLALDRCSASNSCFVLIMSLFNSDHIHGPPITDQSFALLHAGAYVHRIATAEMTMGKTQEIHCVDYAEHIVVLLLVINYSVLIHS